MSLAGGEEGYCVVCMSYNGTCSQCRQIWSHGTIWPIALWRNQWHTRYISITATWAGAHAWPPLSWNEISSIIGATMLRLEVKCKIWYSCTSEKRDCSHKSLPPLILGEVRRRFAVESTLVSPNAHRIITCEPHYQAFSYIFQHTSSYIIFHIWHVFQHLME